MAIANISLKAHKAFSDIDSGNDINKITHKLDDLVSKIFTEHDWLHCKTNLILTPQWCNKQILHNLVKDIYWVGYVRRTGINLGLPILWYDSWGHEIVECNYCAGRGYVAE